MLMFLRWGFQIVHYREMSWQFMQYIILKLSISIICYVKSMHKAQQNNLVINYFPFQDITIVVFYAMFVMFFMQYYVCYTLFYQITYGNDQLFFTIMQKMIPNSFDPHILEDQLFKALKNSPQTKNLISLRAQQIIKQILEKPIQVQLSRQIQTHINTVLQQQHIIEQLQSQLRSMQNKSQKSQKKMKKNIASKLTQNQIMFSKLEEQLNQKDNSIAELVQYKQSLQKQIQNLALDLQAKQQQISSLRQEMQKMANINEDSVKQQLKKKQKQINQIKLSIQGIKKQHTLQIKQNKKMHQEGINLHNQQIAKLKQGKEKSRLKFIQNQTDYQILKKQIDSFKTKYEQFAEQYNTIKQSSAREIANLHSQIKYLNKALSQSARQKKNMEIKIKKIKKIEKIIPKLNELETQNKMNRTLFQQQIKLLKQQCEATISLITDRIGSTINVDLQGYLQKLIRYKEQIGIYRQQKKIKDQIIQKLQKMLQSQTNETLQLKSELRVKKKQEQKLKKQLKRNYQQSDFKLQSIQKKYMQLLKDSTNYS